MIMLTHNPSLHATVFYWRHSIWLVYRERGDWASSSVRLIAGSDDE